MATRLKTLTIAMLLAHLSQPSVIKLLTWPHLIDLRNMVNLQDRQGILLWGQLLAAGAYITPEELADITATLQEVEDVPPAAATSWRWELTSLEKDGLNIKPVVTLINSATGERIVEPPYTANDIDATRLAARANARIALLEVRDASFNTLSSLVV